MTGSTIVIELGKMNNNKFKYEGNDDEFLWAQ